MYIKTSNFSFSRILFFVGLIMITANCKKDNDVEETENLKRNAFIYTITSTGCTSCGDVGIIIDDLHDKMKEDLNVIKYHPSSTSSIDIMAAIHDDYYLESIFPSGGAYSQYYVGDNKVDMSLSTEDMKSYTATTAAELITKDAIAYCEIDKSIIGSDIIADVTVFFNKAASGDYIILVYVLEDNIFFWQNGNPNSGTYQNPNYYHNNVFRENMIRYGLPSSTVGVIHLEDYNSGSSSFSEQLKIAVPKLTLAINSEWDANNLKVLTLIMKKDGSVFTYVNSNISK